MFKVTQGLVIAHAAASMVAAEKSTARVQRSRLHVIMIGRTTTKKRQNTC